MRPTAAAFVAVAVILTALGSFFAFLPARSGTLAFWLLAGAPSVVLAALAAVQAAREDLLREWVTPRWGDFTRGLFGAAVLFAAAYGFARVVCPVGSPREIWLVSLYGQIGDPRVLVARGPWVGVTLLVLALSEEVVWRGMVTQLLAERVGSRNAWVWSAALYALAFVPTGWALGAAAPGPLAAGSSALGSLALGPSAFGPAAGFNPVLVVAALGGGLVWGGMGRIFGSLVPGVLAHALFDWMVIMMFPLWGARLWG